MPTPEIGFDPTLATSATLAALLAKFVVYPVLGLRRNKGDEDEATGRLYVPTRLHTPIVFVSCCLAGGVVSVMTGEPLFASISSALTGLAMAHAAHDATKKN